MSQALVARAAAPIGPAILGILVNFVLFALPVVLVWIDVQLMPLTSQALEIHPQ